MIIVFEGIDGSGKSTAAGELEAYFDSETNYGNTVLESRCLADLDAIFDVDESSEWTVTRRLSPRVLALSRCLELTHSWDCYGEPADDNNEVVICDRYIYTPLVRDCIRGVEAKYISAIYSHLPEPDLLFYIDTDPEEALRRKVEAGIPLGDYESGIDLFPDMAPQQAFLEFQKRCYARYEKVLPNSARIINGNRSANTVFEDILKMVKQVV